jgi:cytochrome c-type biogenesis protein CcmH
VRRRAALAALAFAALAPAAPGQEAPAADPRAIVGAPRGAALSGEALDAQTDETAALLRCPVCQGLSVADSPATMAQNMKVQVRELLAQGYDRAQVLAYFEHSYGEFVRLEPPLRGVNWLVWGAPLAGLAAGLAAVVWALRRQATVSGEAPAASPAAADAEPDPDALPDDAGLAAYVLKVRELAYGWPGGVRPRSPASP